ncbi:uncharacterized protein LOC115457638 [Microcaecilia unicolor]|uniref:Uncharacterized protein LOC115457638 n=1 Tax=Microcaecilia unicolor TaxID=1415580 RepID=A0A6P7WXL3_9AMPH|nr:uncharacterized protein LOC115457638 [Microcaecilia unicolor]
MELMDGFLLCTLFAGVGNIQEQDPPPIVVHGNVGESTCLSLNVSLEEIRGIRWFFSSVYNSEKLWIGEYRNGTFQDRLSGKFDQRLTMNDGKTLKIDELKKNDTGTFEAQIAFSDNNMVEQMFQLCVHGGKQELFCLLFMSITFIAIIVITLLMFFYWKKKRKRYAASYISKIWSYVWRQDDTGIPPRENNDICENLQNSLLESQLQQQVQIVNEVIVPKEKSTEVT